MNRGVMDRLLASPVRRGAMMAGTLAYQALTTVLQTAIVFLIAFAAGARFSGGVEGIAITMLAAALISMIIASLSNAIALLVRQRRDGWRGDTMIIGLNAAAFLDRRNRAAAIRRRCRSQPSSAPGETTMPTASTDCPRQ